jgi:NAD(P)-dependent dehydrogenase (short-subunit alcohol dehydrogenase family)
MRTIPVAGASGGMGRAVAERFLDPGRNVALVARRPVVPDAAAAGRRPPMRRPRAPGGSTPGRTTRAAFDRRTRWTGSTPAAGAVDLRRT